MSPLIFSQGLDLDEVDETRLSDLRNKIKVADERYGSRKMNKEKFLQQLQDGGVTRLDSISQKNSGPIAFTFLHEMFHYILKGVLTSN